MCLPQILVDIFRLYVDEHYPPPLKKNKLKVLIEKGFQAWRLKSFFPPSVDPRGGIINMNYLYRKQPLDFAPHMPSVFWSTLMSYSKSLSGDDLFINKFLCMRYTRVTEYKINFFFFFFSYLNNVDNQWRKVHLTLLFDIRKNIKITLYTKSLIQKNITNSLLQKNIDSNIVKQYSETKNINFKWNVFTLDNGQVIKLITFLC